MRRSALLCNGASASGGAPGGLLGYRIRRAAATEMLYGGVRLQHLSQRPNPLHKARSYEQSMPTLQNERNDLELEYTYIGQRVFPLNMGARNRADSVNLRAQDCYARFLEEKRGLQAAGKPKGRAVCFHSAPKDLSIVTRAIDRKHFSSTPNPSTGRYDVIPTGPTIANTDPYASIPQWLPFQMLKPIGNNWSPAMRSSGTRGPHMQLKQERLDGKGFGWKRKSRSLWQQDIATAGFRPKRFF